MRSKSIAGALITAVLLSGCASSSSEEVATEVQTEVQTMLENFFRTKAVNSYDRSVNGDDMLAIWCSWSKEKTLSFLDGQDAIKAKREKFLNKLNPDMEFMYWTNACNIVIDERPGAREKLVALQEEKGVAADKSRAASKKFQKELDVLDKKANKLGGGSYTQMLAATSSLESFIKQGAQFSLTGQGRDVQFASCSPTTYSTWDQGEPGGSWYCWLHFLDGSEGYTINVNGSNWGGKADRGSSAGSSVEFKVSKALQDWLGT